MNINQISIFVENKPGKLAKLTKFLADNQVDIRAFEIADTSDYGIVRIIVDKPYDTVTLLKDNDWICSISEVVGVKIPDVAGEMSKALAVLDNAGISVDYAYTFPASGDGALMVIKVAEVEKVAGLFKGAGLKVVSQENL